MSTHTARQVETPIRTFALVSLFTSIALAASIVVAALTDRPNSFDLSCLISGAIAVGLLRGSDKATAFGYRFSLVGLAVGAALVLLRVVGVIQLDDTRFGAFTTGEPASFAVLAAGLALCGWGVLTLRSNA